MVSVYGCAIDTPSAMGDLQRVGDVTPRERSQKRDVALDVARLVIRDVFEAAPLAYPSPLSAGGAALFPVVPDLDSGRFSANTFCMAVAVAPVSAPRIHIVDDDPVLLRGMARAVARVWTDAHVVPFEDAQEALEETVRMRPRLLITDNDMPVLRGVDLVREVREQLGPRAPRVLLVTGGPVNTIDEMLVDRWLAKPFHVPEIIKQVEELLALPLRPQARSGVRSKSDG